MKGKKWFLLTVSVVVLVCCFMISFFDLRQGYRMEMIDVKEDTQKEDIEKEEIIQEEVQESEVSFRDSIYQNYPSVSEEGKEWVIRLNESWKHFQKISNESADPYEVYSQSEAMDTLKGFLHSESSMEWPAGELDYILGPYDIHIMEKKITVGKQTHTVRVWQYTPGLYVQIVTNVQILQNEWIFVQMYDGDTLECTELLDGGIAHVYDFLLWKEEDAIHMVLIGKGNLMFLWSFVCQYGTFVPDELFTECDYGQDIGVSYVLGSMPEAKESGWRVSTDGTMLTIENSGREAHRDGLVFEIQGENEGVLFYGVDKKGDTCCLYWDRKNNTVITEKP